MMAGVVNADREATLRLVVAGPSGKEQEIHAIIDTGFTGFLTLPAAHVAALGLSWLCRQPGILADGSVNLFDVYAATVLWDGRLSRSGRSCDCHCVPVTQLVPFA